MFYYYYYVSGCSTWVRSKYGSYASSLCDLSESSNLNDSVLRLWSMAIFLKKSNCLMFRI